MLKIYLLWPGKTKVSWLQDGIEFYLKKLRNYYQVKLTATRAARGRGKRKTDILEKEAEYMRKALPQRGYRVALDLKGKPLSSEELARFIKKVEETGVRNLTFIIGGAYGMAPGLLNECDFSIALSRMTFTHEMSRLILLEQLYRAAGINAGSPYHH